MKNKKKQQGILTLDFLFSFIAVYGISMVFCALAITLMAADITQYISFSVTRAHIAGDISRENQISVAAEHYDKITAAVSTLIKTNNRGWFSIKKKGGGPQQFDNFSWSNEAGKRQTAYGSGLDFTANILKKMKLPLIGSPASGASGDFAKANIYTFLYREPTTNECLNFNKSRWQAIKKKFPQIGSMNINGDNFGAQADNGC